MFLQSDKVLIEWRPNDVSIDTECQEDTEWALVNTNTRTRTSSGWFYLHGLFIYYQLSIQIQISLILVHT